jgi:glycerophosphoryl diester phosphodiesterase
MTAADQLAPAPDAESPPAKRDKPVGAFRAIGIAWLTTWRQPQFYVLTVASIQLVLIVLAIPLLRMIYQLVLVETGLGSVAYDKISTVLQNPLADLTLLVLALVAVLIVFTEFTTLFTLAAHHQQGDSTSFRLVLRQVWATIRKLFHPQGLLIVVYLLLLLPLAHLGLSSTLTKKIGVPPFVSEELGKSASTSIAYVAILLVLAYVNLRLILTMPLLATTDATVWQSLVTSWRLTRWRAFRIVGMLIMLGLSALWFVVLLLVLSVVPTIITDISAPALSPAAATIGLSLWQIGGFILAALLTISVVQGLVAMMHDWLPRMSAKHQHDVHEIHDSEPSRVTADWRRKLWIIAAAVLVVAFGVASVLNFSTLTRLAAVDETSIIAHRGFVEGGVENTLPALVAADKAGSDRVEFDVLQTKDLKFVVMHDSNLQRLAGINANVKDLTQAQLMDITVRAGDMQAKIPSLEQWIAESKKLDLPQLLEVKLHGGESPDLLPRLLAVLDAAKVTDWYTYHSISRDVVQDLKELRPQLVVGFIVPINFGGIPKVNADFLVVEQASYDDNFRNDAWGKGYKVVVWTVNEEQAMRNYLGDEVNGLITDQPGWGVAERDDIENAEGLSGRLSDMLSRSSAF